jgi:aminomethyltransferase
MGEFSIKGPGALDLIQKVTSNDASKLIDFQVQYSCMPNENGGIVDDLLVYRYNSNEYYLVVNASNIEKDWNHIMKYNTDGVEMTNLSDELSLFAVQGPLAIKALQKLTDINLSEIKYYHFAAGEMAGLTDVIISNTGYTGAGGFEIYVWNKDARTMWDAIMDAGKEFGIEPIGLGARDTLRLEKAFCLYGNDINDSTSPIEAGLGWITKFTKDFVGRNIIESHKINGVSKKLVGFELVDKGIPRQHYPICTNDNKVIGEVTSGTQSPSLHKAIGMGYVESAFATPGTEIYIEVRGKLLKAVVVKTPFL